LLALAGTQDRPAALSVSTCQEQGIGLLGSSREMVAIGHNPSLAAAGRGLPHLHSQGDAHLREEFSSINPTPAFSPLFHCSLCSLLKPPGSHTTYTEMDLCYGFNVSMEHVFYFPEFRDDSLTATEERRGAWNRKILNLIRPPIETFQKRGHRIPPQVSPRPTLVPYPRRYSAKSSTASNASFNAPLPIGA